MNAAGFKDKIVCGGGQMRKAGFEVMFFLSYRTQKVLSTQKGDNMSFFLKSF